MRPMNVLVLASLNRGKEEEFSQILSRFNYQLGSIEDFIRNYKQLALVENEKEGATYIENALRKCKAAFYAAKAPTIADDSGLEIEALEGKPGVHSAHFAKPNARESQSAANRRHVLELLEGKSNRKASMKCVIVFMLEGVELIATGECKGAIALKEQGSGGFGYDSIFLPEGFNGKSFAEISVDEKNRISHRAMAIENLIHQIQKNEIQLVRP
ncbi:MAG: RdgB/HAM1 family non-canonical purine NTP pyrophosphatase [Oligoflexia bacterium]|nr:RdgB/HAM1 family non-canonical purine NTP pyrophosphatase [Oligoflexia bacterium]